MTAIAASESLGAVFVGGMIEGNANSIGVAGKLPVIQRMDLDGHTWRWRKSF